MTGPDDKAGTDDETGLDKTVAQTGQTLGETVAGIGDGAAEITHPVINETDTVAAEALETIEAAQSAAGGALARITGILRSRGRIIAAAGVAIVVAFVWRRR